MIIEIKMIRTLLKEKMVNITCDQDSRKMKKACSELIVRGHLWIYQK